MFSYVLRRLLATLPVMLFVALFVFALLDLAPGDPRRAAGRARTPPRRTSRASVPPWDWTSPS